MLLITINKKQKSFLALLLIGIIINGISISTSIAGSLVGNPFPKDLYQNTTTAYRLVGVGKSSNESVAQSMAMFNAKERLTKAIIASYNASFPNKKINQVELIDITSIKEEMEQGADNSNSDWVIIEVDKNELLTSLLKTEFPDAANEKKYKTFIKKLELEINKQKK